MTDDLKARLLNEDHAFHEAACHEAWAKIEALTAERDARIDPAHVQALLDTAEPAMAEAIAALQVDNARYRKLLDAIVDEYYGQMHGPALASIEAACAELAGEK